MIPNHAKKLISWGIDGITTDRAQWLSDKLIKYLFKKNNFLI